MATAGNMKDPAVAKKLFENLQSDLRVLSTEGKRKHPNVKEVIMYTQAHSSLLYLMNQTFQLSLTVFGTIILINEFAKTEPLRLSGDCQIDLYQTM